MKNVDPETRKNLEKSYETRQAWNLATANCFKHRDALQKGIEKYYNIWVFICVV